LQEVIAFQSKDVLHTHTTYKIIMIVETFRGGDPVPVYRRFRDQGRLAPDGLRYVASWVTQDLRRCFQIMECDEPSLIDQWTAHWADIAEFEVTAVVTSAEAQGARPILGLDQRLERGAQVRMFCLMKFDNQNRQCWNRGFSRSHPPEGSTPVSYYRT
jgi:Protein of unknown function (DUF3303)